MFYCKKCNSEITEKSFNRDGLCSKCRASLNRKLKDKVMRDMGMIKVRGSLGGTYWE